MSQLPELLKDAELGFSRPVQVYGDPSKGIPGVIPSSPSTFWRKVKSGEYSELEFIRQPNLTLITNASIRRECQRMVAEARSEEKQVA